MILKAAVTFSCWRRRDIDDWAGVHAIDLICPCSSLASPAPLTMQPMVPFRDVVESYFDASISLRPPRSRRDSAAVGIRTSLAVE